MQDLGERYIRDQNAESKRCNRRKDRQRKIEE